MNRCLLMSFLLMRSKKMTGICIAKGGDITIATKFLTRNNPVTGELNQDAYSGWFALTLQEDPFFLIILQLTEAHKMSDRQYWDLGYFGTRRKYRK